MRGHWLFLHVRGGNGWEWQRVDRESGELLERSRQLFMALRDCIGDATTHGYPAGDEKGEIVAGDDPRAMSSAPTRTWARLKKPAAKP